MPKQDRHIHEGNAANRDMIVMTAPLFLMAFFYYGPRVLVLALLAVVTARLTDRLASMLRARRYDKTENSSVVFALLIVLMMPATVRYRVVIVAVLVAVLVGKEAFGGYRSYPFNPAAVGICVASVSWPEDMFRYPPPQNWMLQTNLPFDQLLRLWRFTDVSLMEGPSTTLRGGGLPKIGVWDLLLGNYGGPLGVCCVLVVASCALYLLAKKRLPLAAPVSFMAVVVLISFLFPRYTEISWATFPQDIEIRLQVVKFESLTGALLFAAMFLVDEPGTLPKNVWSQLIYGTLLGVAAMMFRYFGTFELSTCFAILLVNAVSGYFDRAIVSGLARRKGVPAP